MTEQTWRVSPWTKARMVLFTLVLFAAGLVLIRRAWVLQIKESATLGQLAREQYLKDIRLAPKRGTIYDRNGAELAISVETDSIWANPRVIRKSGKPPEVLASEFAQHLEGVDVKLLIERLASEKYFVWIKRHASPAEAEAVRALGLPGVEITREARRFYPHRELAAQVLGFANIDGSGIEGIELSFEPELRGRANAVSAVLDRRGKVVFSEHLLDNRTAQGDDLVLTIDKTLQHVAERELAQSVEASEAHAGSVVMLDPHTGEILAMANYPTFNPNQPGLTSIFNRRNRAITDRFEPGSTIKPFTVAGVLAAGLINPSQEIDCEKGSMQVAEYVIHDTHAWSRLTPAQILARSSNIGAAKLGTMLGKQGLHRALSQFGFGELTGIPFPGETPGMLRQIKHWYEMDVATIAFGQGMSASNLQIALATAALANGGKLLSPILVKRIVRADGTVAKHYQPTLRKQAVSASVATAVSHMLTAVTSTEGTGSEAAIPGHLVAGKTGTAQKADRVGGGYASDRWVASFVGFVPAHAPKIVISVVIDEPMIAHHGGTVASPVFRRLGAQALARLGVPADSGGEALVQAQKQQANSEASVSPRVSALQETHEPPAIESSSVSLNAEGVAQEVRVPSVLGMTVRTVVKQLLASGLQVELEGHGVAQEQSPPGSSWVARGSTIRVACAPNRLQPRPKTDQGPARELPKPVSPPVVASAPWRLGVSR